MDTINIKDKVEAYRRQKRKAEMTESIKNVIHNVLPWNGNKTATDSIMPLTINDMEAMEDVESSSSDGSTNQSKCSVLVGVMNLLYFLLWITVYIIAIKYEFGAVYFILSMLMFICLNTGTKRKKSGEPSAYSVFNPNCEPINGTLDASQMERELGLRVGSIR